MVGRRVVIAKELTKLFETFHLCTLGEAAAWFEADSNRLKGEFVLILEAEPASKSDDMAEGLRVLSILLGDGLSVKQAVGLAAKIGGAPKKLLYEQALLIRGDTAPA